MSKVFIEESTLDDIANAIQEQEGSEEKIPTAEMAARILALGGAVEYTTGTVTFTQSYAGKTIPHGLSKAPKLFVLYWEDVENSYHPYLSFVTSTEYLGYICYGGGTEHGLRSAYITHYGCSNPTYGKMTVDDTNVSIAEVARQWRAGNWIWEAYTW